MQWSREYGDIISVYVGSRLQVVLSDLATARRVFTDERAVSRQTKSMVRHEGGELFPGMGLVFTNQEHYKPHRRFALATLRDLGKMIICFFQNTLS